MKILKLLILFILLGINISFAAVRTEYKNLTIAGAPVIAYNISSGATVTSDSVYESGAYNYNGLATIVNGSVKITYQASYDNINWWTPNTTSAGTLTATGVLATSVTSNTWVSFPAVVAPYIRFNYQSTGASSITAETLWQDWS